MLRKRIRESLTARIFVITAGILLFAGAITFSFIAWATPSTYTAVVNDDLTAQVNALVEKLADTSLADCGNLLDEFVLSSGANAMLVGPDGHLVDTGAKLTIQAVYEDNAMIITAPEQENAVSYHGRNIPEDHTTDDTMSVTMSEQATITAEVTFTGQSENYILYVAPRIETESAALTRPDRVLYARDQLLATIRKVAPYIFLGVGVGAVIHNVIPQTWVETVLGDGNPLAVVLATLVGVPMYADIFGTIPVAESLLFKGAGLGTILSFMMAVTTLSLPSLIMLRKAVKPKLLGAFIAVCTVGIILVGYFFNFFQQFLL